jgi:RNA polymerase sigma-70 factor (ECF subfamily)
MLIPTKDRSIFLSEIYTKMFRPLCNYASRIISNEEVVFDIVHDFFLNLLIKKDEINISKDVEAYMYVALRNRLLNYLKKPNLIFDEALINEREEESNDNYELSERVTEQIDLLPKRTKAIFYLMQKGYNNIEIANTLGISINTVKTLKKRGYVLIRQGVKL